MDSANKKRHNDIMCNIKTFHLALLFVFFGLNSYSQTQIVNTKNKNPFPVKYTSEIDSKIILKTITLAPVYDNANGIYSVPIQKLLIDLLQSDKVLGYSAFPTTNKKIFVESFDTKPTEVLDLLKKTESQGLMTALITKGPRGMNARLKLYTQDQGIVLLEDSFSDLKTFELSRLREEFVTLYHNIKNKLPYRGIIQSRRGLEVTLNLGTLNGVEVGQELAVAQILKLNRHPKLKTLVGIEKELIGRVKVTKVEPYLSFAQIIFEKETGVVDVGAKVLPNDFISYPIPILNSVGEVVGDEKFSMTKLSKKQLADLSRKDDSVKTIEALDLPEKNQNETLVEIKHEPLSESSNTSTGISLYALGGISQYAESTSFSGGTSADSKQSAALTLLMGGELSFFETYSANINYQMQSFKSDNSLTYSLTKYSLMFGYTYYLDDETKAGSKFIGSLGYSVFKTDVSETSPTIFTSTQTNGLSLKLEGLVPISTFELGAYYQFMLSPQYLETPVNSGDASPIINTIGLVASYKVSENLTYRAEIILDSLQSNFNGAGSRSIPATSNSIKNTSEVFGVQYTF